MDKSHNQISEQQSLTKADPVVRGPRSRVNVCILTLQKTERRPERRGSSRLAGSLIAFQCCR